MSNPNLSQIEGMSYLESPLRKAVTTYLPLAVFVFVLLFPFYWMGTTSFKPDEELYDYAHVNPFWIAHPTLPCGVKLYIRFGGKQVLTEVVDRGPNVPGRDFDITKGLADRIGLHGTQTIHWRYAR